MIRYEVSLHFIPLRMSCTVYHLITSFLSFTEPETQSSPSYYYGLWEISSRHAILSSEEWRMEPSALSDPDADRNILSHYLDRIKPEIPSKISHSNINNP